MQIQFRHYKLGKNLNMQKYPPDSTSHSTCNTTTFQCINCPCERQVSLAANSTKSSGSEVLPAGASARYAELVCVSVALHKHSMEQATCPCDVKVWTIAKGSMYTLLVWLSHCLPPSSLLPPDFSPRTPLLPTPTPPSLHRGESLAEARMELGAEQAPGGWNLPSTTCG